jgi:predicted O-methyltransferase YrrM
MNAAQWTSVDQYLAEQSIPPDPVLESALAASSAAHLPAINVTPHQGKFLHLLARLQGARRILEIGTLGGYSTLWLARALPAGGRVVTLELEEVHARVARENFARAGLADKVELKLGRAIDLLQAMIAEKVAPFDFVFIDADKPSMAEYFQAVLQLTRPGSVIIADNVVRNGAVVDASSTDASVQGVRRFMAALARETRVSATTLQTVGSKGYDGFTLAVVNE